MDWLLRGDWFPGIVVIVFAALFLFGGFRFLRQRNRDAERRKAAFSAGARLRAKGQRSD